MEKGNRYLSKPLYVGILFCLLSNHVFAAEVNEQSSTQLLHQAVEDEQSNQSSFNLAYRQASADAYYDVANGIVLSKNQMEAALKAVIAEETSKGNSSLAVYLKNILDWMEKDTSDFPMSYNPYLTSEIDCSLDQEAVNALQSTIASDYMLVIDMVTAAQKQIEESINSTSQYLENNSFAYDRIGQFLPEIADGSIAEIFYIDAANGCYYLNAGEYSGATVGSIYGIANSNGDAIGFVKVLKTSVTYCAGALINTSAQDDIFVGNAIPSLKTYRTPPNP